jgi:hypothetical protein
MKKVLFSVFGTIVLLFGMTHVANANTLLFYDDFESDLSKWTGKGSGAHHGEIVADPISGGINDVLHFTALNKSGDVFSVPVSLSSTGKYILSFDYLGLDSGPGIDGNLGGAIGYSYGLPGGLVWLAGTTNIGPGTDILGDTGRWGHYQITFTATQVNTPIHIMVEDWVESLGIAGDAYFDNIKLTGVDAVPEPATMILFGIGLAGIGGLRIRLKKHE